MNALAESPFLCRNGSRAIMAFIRTLPVRARGPERLRIIAEALLRPLLARLGALPAGSKVGLVVCLAERFDDAAPAPLRKGRGELEAALLALLRSRGLEVVHIFVPRGHASLAHGIIEANAVLSSRDIDVAIVGGLDTYYDPDVVESLLEQNRIFDGENLDSFIPGEGGAFCLIARSDIASRYKWPVLARVESAASNEEPAHRGTDLPCLGLGLSRPMRAISDRLLGEHRVIDFWLGDVTNEDYRNQEWLLAIPRACADVTKPKATSMQFLPAFLGDLGAATMATAAVLAVESFLRGDLKADNCLIFGSSFGEHRGAVLLASESSAPAATEGGSRAPQPATGPASIPPRRASREIPAASPPKEATPGAVAPSATELGAKLGLISYASACAEAAVYPPRTAAAWTKYGLAGLAVVAEHEAWRRHFEKYPEERAEFDRQFEQLKEHWRTQKP
jgi:3-oxoacyl-[acyl-carrier-protein] synthase-1